MSALPWLLLATTLIVRLLLARKLRAGWYIDLASVAPWLLYYWTRGDYQLLAIPLLFAALDLKALHWWRT